MFYNLLGLIVFGEFWRSAFECSPIPAVTDNKTTFTLLQYNTSGFLHWLGQKKNKSGHSKMAKKVRNVIKAVPFTQKKTIYYNILE